LAGTGRVRPCPLFFGLRYTSYMNASTPLPYCDQIICGDSYQLLGDLPSGSIDLVITSPPYYQQRDYGGGVGNEATPEAYIQALMMIFEACVRVIKPTGSIVWNLGDKYEKSSLLLMPYRFAQRAVAHTGVRLVNTITWVKANPTPRQFKRRLVSSTEPFFHFVKTDQYQYFPEAFQTSAPNPTMPKKNHNAGRRIGQKYKALIEGSDLTPAQKAMAEDELAKVISEVHQGEIEGFRMKIRGIHAEPFGGQEGGRKIQLERNGFTIIRIYGEPLKRDVIMTPVESLKGNPHPATFPTLLVEEFLRLLTNPDDIVLDPFMGSGTTGVAAIQTRRHYLGFDINPDYCAYATTRIEETGQQIRLW